MTFYNSITVKDFNVSFSYVRAVVDVRLPRKTEVPKCYRKNVILGGISKMRSQFSRKVPAKGRPSYVGSWAWLQAITSRNAGVRRSLVEKFLPAARIQFFPDISKSDSKTPDFFCDAHMNTSRRIARENFIDRYFASTEKSGHSKFLNFAEPPAGSPSATMTPSQQPRAIDGPPKGLSYSAIGRREVPEK